MSRWVDGLARRAAGVHVSRPAGAHADRISLVDHAARAVAAPSTRRGLIGAGAGTAVGLSVLGRLDVPVAHAQVEECTECGVGAFNMPVYCPCFTPVCCKPPENVGDGGPGNYCCGEGSQCCFASSGRFQDHACCEAGGTCNQDASGAAVCCPASRPNPCPGPFDFNCCANTETCVNGECVPGCPPGQQPCGATCCPPGQTCEQASATCVTPCPDLQPRCGDRCCPAGQFCVEGMCRSCPPGQEACGDKCCEAGKTCVEGNVCCDKAGNICTSGGRVACCGPDQDCCAVGSLAQGGSGGVPQCCPPGAVCAREIVGDNVGITSGSPKVCCPPDRLVTQTGQPICCPPGQVVQPRGVFSTAGGFCCRTDDVCGGECCADFHGDKNVCCGGKTCCGPTQDGFICVKGKCTKVAHTEPSKRVRAQADGDVPLRLDCPSGSCSGSVSLSTVSAGAAGAFMAARPVALGTSRFRQRKRGKGQVQVRLSRSGRRLLARRGQIRVTATVRTQVGGRQVVSTSRPFTLQVPAKRKR